ncbi:hypothetical protein ACGF5M_00635 [Gemmatimonadota bacterium]
MMRPAGLSASFGAIRRKIAGWLIVGLVALGLGCAGRHSAPVAGSESGGVPDLRGRQVMLFPVQSVRGLAEDMDAELELAFALTGRGSQVLWILPAEIRSALARSPGLQVPIDALPVGMFLQAEVDRVGDPLFGYLRRLGALTGADLALIPVEIRYRAAADTVPGATEIAAALLSARNGRVFWFGVVEGQGGGADDPGSLASAADALARRLVR